MKKTLTLVVLALLGSAPKFAQASSDGTPSTGSFTVVNVSSLSAASATGSLTVLSTSAARGMRVNIGAYTFKEGVEWNANVSIASSAIHLAAAINASNAPVSASTSSNVVNLTADDSGTLYNGVSLYSSEPSAISTSAATLRGGQDNAYLSINANRLTQGTDWFTQDVASNTAISIAAAINNSRLIGQYVSAVPLSTQIYLRAILSPAAYSLASSAPADLTVSGAAMTGGSAGNLARFTCNLGLISALPTSNYPAGCTAYLSTDPTKLYLSTQTVVGTQSWLAK